MESLDCDMAVNYMLEIKALYDEKRRLCKAFKIS